MPKQNKIGRQFDTYIKVKLENQKQVAVAEDFGVSPPTIHKWLDNVEKEFEKASTLQHILEYIGDKQSVAELMDIDIAVIDAHLDGTMTINPAKLANLIVDEGLDFEEICGETETNLPPSQQTAGIVDVEPPAEPTKEDVSTEPTKEDVSTEPTKEDVSTEPTKEDVSTEDLFKSLHQAFNTMQDTLKIIQERIITEDDLLSFLESKRTNKKEKHNEARTF